MIEINRRWRLSNPEQSHIVEICQNDISEVGGIADYLREGLQNGEGVIIFVSSALRKRILTNIKALEAGYEKFRGEGRVKFFDIEFMLANILVNGILIEKYFLDLIGKPIQRSQLKFGKVRVYGGMTGVFWKNSQYDIATCLENYWISLARKQKFSLFSSYLLSNHNSLTENSLKFLYECYNHLIPKRKYDPFRVEDHELMNTFEETWRKFKHN